MKSGQQSLGLAGWSHDLVLEENGVQKEATKVCQQRGVLVQNPIQAIVQHSEHNVLYAQDPLMQGFHSRHISHMLDIVCENQGQTGFSAAEIGAGTGGFTRQVRPRFAQLVFQTLRI